jgi:hypothetical protein
MKGKVNMSNVAAAIAAGGLYDAAMQAASRRVSMIADNYQVVRAGGGALLGYALLHFGKSETMKAAGYGVLGVAGAGIGSKLAYQLTETAEPGSVDENPVQGLKRRLNRPAMAGGSSGRSAMIARAIRQKRSGPPPRLMNPNRLPMEKVVGRQPMVVTDRGENWLAEFSEAAY